MKGNSKTPQQMYNNVGMNSESHPAAAAAAARRASPSKVQRKATHLGAEQRRHRHAIDAIPLGRGRHRRMQCYYIPLAFQHKMMSTSSFYFLNATFKDVEQITKDLDLVHVE